MGGSAVASEITAPADTFPRLLGRNARQFADRPAIRHKDLGIWQTLTWAQVFEDVRAYAQRAWKVAEARKQEHWAREFVEHGPQATFEASQVLWRHMRSLRPDWPSPEERREDLAHHIALKQLIDRAAGAFVAAHR